MPRGGKRNGTPGKAYPNRADLRSVQPIPGGNYGEQTAQAAVQQATPESSPAAPVPPGVLPGSQGPLTRPTERPDEPLSAGAPWGPGPNSVPGINPNAPGMDMRKAIRMLPLLEIMASNPNASPQTRNLYRSVLDAHLRSQSL